MTGLIEEIQRDALDNKVPIENLLRRVKLAAAKLRLETVETWVEKELTGYGGDVPDYRKAYGQPAAWNPYHGWQPVQVSDDAISEFMSEARVGQSISSLRDLLDHHGSGDGVLHFPIPAGFVAELNKVMNFQTARMVIQISRGHIVGILDHVRNMVLDWAIEMERQGIVGEGMSFSAHEREEAKQVMANFNVGSIGSFIGNMGSGNSSGDINTGSVSIEQIRKTTEQIRAALPELERAGADQAALSSALTGIDQETSSSTPDDSRLRHLLQDARTALVGAAGNLTADGAIAGIAALLRALGGGT